MSLTCIVDADFIISQVMKSDVNHKKAVEIAKYLVQSKAKVLYPTTAIIEAATTILRKYNNPILAQEVLDSFKDIDLQVLSVDHEVIIQTAKDFDPRSSKKHTPFDCAILSLAKIKKADAILSFDKYFKNKGFKVAAQLN